MVRCWLVLGLLAGSGCNLVLGLDDPSTGAGPTEPAIDAVSPIDGADAVDRGAVVTVTFASAMDGRTLDADALRLTTATGEAVAATVSYDDATRTLRLVPAEALAMRGRYTAALADDLGSADGHELGAVEAWTFTVRDGRWREPVLLSGASEYPTRQMLTRSRAGTVAVWQQQDDTYFFAMSRSLPGGEWTPPEGIGGTGHAAPSATAISPSGTIMLVWLAPATSKMMASWLSPAGSWTEPRDIGPPGIELRGLHPVQLIFDRNNVATALWSAHQGNRAQVWRNTWANQVWGQAVQLSGEDVSGFSPQLAVNPAGDSAAIWMETAGPNEATTYGLVGGRMATSGPPVEAQVIRAPSLASVGAPQIGIDDDGTAIAIWTDYDGDPAGTLLASVLGGGGWSSYRALENDAGGSSYYQLDVSAAGTRMALWAHSDGLIWSASYQPIGGWQPGAPIHAAAIADPTFVPAAALDARGDGVALFTRMVVDQAQLWSARYVEGSGWAPPVPLGLTPDEGGNDPGVQLVMDPDSGVAHAIWIRDDGERETVWASTFD